MSTKCKHFLNSFRNIIYACIWVDFMSERLKFLKEEFIRATKRILKQEKPKNEDTLSDIKIEITTTYNRYIEYTASIEPRLELDSKEFLRKQLLYVREKLQQSYAILKCDYYVPDNLLKQIDPKVSRSKSFDDDPDDSDILDNLSDIETTESKDTPSKNHNSENTGFDSANKEQKINKMAPSENVEFIKAATAILCKNFSGDPLALLSFIDAIKLSETLATTDGHRKLLINLILTKLEGKAREFIPDEPNSIEQIILLLKENIKPDSSKVIEGRMQALRADSVPLQEFAKKADELADCFRRSLVMEGISLEKASEMTVDRTVEMCRASARTDLVKSVLASSSFKNHKEVVAKFLVEVNTESKERRVLSVKSGKFNKNKGQNFKGQRSFRGRQKGNYGDRNRRNYNNYNSNNNYNGNQNNRGNRGNNNGRNYSNGNGRSNDRGYNDRNVRVLGNADAPQWHMVDQMTNQEINPRGPQIQ